MTVVIFREVMFPQRKFRTMLRALRDSVWCLLILGLVAQQSPSVQAAEWGSLSGKFVYTGPPVKQQKAAFPEPPSLVVGPQGGIKNIFVYLKERNFNPERIHPDFRKLPNLVVIEHRNQRFEPHAAALWQPHQKLVFSNQSPRVHVTQLFPLKNQRPDISAIGPGRKETIPFEYPELLPIQIKCDIHPFETGYLLVLDHPYVSISDETGTFQIKNLPVGEWEFHVWHEQAGHLAAREDWQKGRIKLQIKPGENDLGVIKVSPEMLEQKTAQK
ncbi:MAG: hypothetical protein ACIAZJ_26695 [Gimesia chilikensis]|uniref:hypothetical protein n=1 Tax=Gimesia chilikensis TaxID=2605989 RepID=UPI00378AE0A5